MDNRELLLGLARTFAGQEGTFLLYSGGNFDSAQKSILGLFPITAIHTASLETLKHSLDLTKGPWLGWIDYEGNAYFQTCSIIVILDHLKDTFQIYVAPDAVENEWIKFLQDVSQWNKIATPSTEILKQTIHSIIKPLETVEAYIKKVKIAQEYIQQGDIYQVNLSQKMVLEGNWQPFELFYTFTKTNPAPFSAYIHAAHRFIISTSPERLLQKKGMLLETRPIKGTAPRGKTVEQDFKNRRALLQSPKELAELLMITDLMRNDLSRVSIPGTVQVKKLWHCEAYTNIFHLLSIINAEAKADLHPFDILRSCFPGGSITGCPKKRAMNIIDEIEKTPRGIYTGSIGYIDKEDFDFNIAIRTIDIQDSFLSFQLGGGIVADSNPYEEYQETLYKGRTIFNALGMDPNSFSKNFL